MGSLVSSLLFQPPPASYGLEDPRLFRLRTSEGHEIGAFWVDNQEPLTILFSHGNAEDIGMVYNWFKELARILRVNVLAYDYSGYGHNKNQPSEESSFKDIEAAFEFLTKTKGCEPGRVVLWGRSLGSGPSCYLAEKQSALGEFVKVVRSLLLLSLFSCLWHREAGWWVDSAEPAHVCLQSRLSLQILVSW